MKIKFKFFLILMLAASSVFAQNLSKKEKLQLYNSVKKSLAEYEKFAGLTPNFQVSEKVDEKYLASFKSLFTEDAEIYNDLHPSKKADTLPINKYTAYIQKHYTIGIAVDSLKLNYYNIVPGESGKLLRVNVQKSWYGYFNDSTYTEKKIKLNIFYRFSGENKIEKIEKIEKMNPKPVPVKRDPKALKQEAKLLKKADRLQRKIDKYQAKLDGINDEIRELNFNPQDEEYLEQNFKQNLKPE